MSDRGKQPAMNEKFFLLLFAWTLKESPCFVTADNRRQHVERKARHYFKHFKAATDPDTIDFQVKLAETQLDNVIMQRQLLNQLAEEGNLKGPR